MFGSRMLYSTVVAMRTKHHIFTLHAWRMEPLNLGTLGISHGNLAIAVITMVVVWWCLGKP